LNKIIAEVLATQGPVFCNVDLLPGAQIYPKLLYGRPIEDATPLLPRDEFASNMIIPLIS
jgi:acetolactate synthase-1/2/3 large subunit